MTVFNMITTERLIIESFDEALLTEQYVNWLNDPIVVQSSRQRHRRHTLEDCREYFLSFSGSNNLFLAVKLKQDSKTHIGNMTITVDTINRVADVAILIGDRQHWGRGYGFESWNAVCHFLLKTKEYRKVTGGCYSTNEAMKRIMIKSNMKFDGIRKHQVLVNNKPTDIVYFAFFNPSWSHQ